MESTAAGQRPRRAPQPGTRGRVDNRLRVDEPHTRKIKHHNRLARGDRPAGLAEHEPGDLRPPRSTSGEVDGHLAGRSVWDRSADGDGPGVSLQRRQDVARRLQLHPALSQRQRARALRASPHRYG